MTGVIFYIAPALRENGCRLLFFMDNLALFWRLFLLTNVNVSWHNKSRKNDDRRKP